MPNEDLINVTISPSYKYGIKFIFEYGSSSFIVKKRYGIVWITHYSTAIWNICRFDDADIDNKYSILILEHNKDGFAHLVSINEKYIDINFTITITQRKIPYIKKINAKDIVHFGLSSLLNNGLNRSYHPSK